MANYSGNLVRTYATPAETAGAFHPDPRHAVTDTPDPNGAVHRVPPDTGQEYSGTQIPVDVAVGGGSILGTPDRSHDGRAGRRMVYTDDQHRESLADRHAEDGQRRYVQHRYQLPLLQDAHAVYSDFYYEDTNWPATPNNTGAVAILRGLYNDIPQNNPMGVRGGMARELLFRAERRLGRRKYRYDIQQSVLRATYQDGDVPAPAGADPTAAGTVLPKWNPYGQRQPVKIPALFRTPPAIDDAALGAPEPSAYSGGVIGGGL